MIIPNKIVPQPTTTKLPLLEQAVIRQVNKWTKTKARKLTKKPSTKDLIASIILLYGR
jgi:hypothetical protein